MGVYFFAQCIAIFVIGSSTVGAAPTTRTVSPATASTATVTPVSDGTGTNTPAGGRGTATVSRTPIPASPAATITSPASASTPAPPVVTSAPPPTRTPAASTSTPVGVGSRTSTLSPSSSRTPAASTSTPVGVGSRTSTLSPSSSRTPTVPPATLSVQFECADKCADVSTFRVPVVSASCGTCAGGRGRRGDIAAGTARLIGESAAGAGRAGVLLQDGGGSGGGGAVQQSVVLSFTSSAAAKAYAKKLVDGTVSPSLPKPAALQVTASSTDGSTPVPERVDVTPVPPTSTTTMVPSPREARHEVPYSTMAVLASKCYARCPPCPPPCACVDCSIVARAPASASAPTTSGGNLRQSSGGGYRVVIPYVTLNSTSECRAPFVQTTVEARLCAAREAPCALASLISAAPSSAAASSATTVEPLPPTPRSVQAYFAGGWQYRAPIVNGVFDDSDVGGPLFSVSEAQCVESVPFEPGAPVTGGGGAAAASEGSGEIGLMMLWIAVAAFLLSIVCICCVGALTWLRRANERSEKLVSTSALKPAPPSLTPPRVQRPRAQVHPERVVQVGAAVDEDAFARPTESRYMRHSPPSPAGVFGGYPPDSAVRAGAPPDGDHDRHNLTSTRADPRVYGDVSVPSFGGGPPTGRSSSVQRNWDADVIPQPARDADRPQAPPTRPQRNAEVYDSIWAGGAGAEVDPCAEEGFTSFFGGGGGPPPQQPSVRLPDSQGVGAATSSAPSQSAAGSQSAPPQPSHPPAPSFNDGYGHGVEMTGGAASHPPAAAQSGRLGPAAGSGRGQVVVGASSAIYDLFTGGEDAMNGRSPFAGP